jgi:hypothetical protein
MVKAAQGRGPALVQERLIERDASDELFATAVSAEIVENTKRSVGETTGCSATIRMMTIASLMEMARVKYGPAGLAGGALVVMLAR